jgi:2-methylcitrate dehydratase PrpD
VPFGGAGALRVGIPNTGLEGKFSGPYTVAAALTDGHVGLKAFEDEDVLRPELQSLAKRTVLIEDELDGPMPIGMNVGTVRLTVKRGDEILAKSEVEYFPGSPEQPITDDELATKAQDCVDHSIRKGETSISASDLLASAAGSAPLH